MLNNKFNEYYIDITPKDIIDFYIIKYKNNIKNILEPSCGNSEFFKIIDESFNNININCIEYSKKIYDDIKLFKSNNNNHFTILNDNYLNYDDNILYDLIISNPPHYTLKKKAIDLLYKDYYEGNANIYILFIIHSLKKLNKYGILCFILPKNFMNNLLYNRLRKHIYDNFKIINILNCSNSKFKYINKEDSIIFIIRNSNNKNDNNLDFTLNINNYTIFNTKSNIIKLKELYKNSKTLNELNFNVSISSILWNEVKELLSNNVTKINIIYNNLQIIEFNNICIDNIGSNKLLFVENNNENNLIEKNLICINYNNEINKDELKILYIKIINSFSLNKTKEFIKIYFGYDAITITEIQYILPIYNI